MSDQFKAIVLNQEGENFSREVKSLDKSFLKHGDVTVKVEYSGLNYKDALILKNGARLVKEFPHIPGIDFSGIVEDSSNEKFKLGDEVILTGWRVGEIYFGGYSQYAKVNGDFLVKKPKNLTSKQAMIMGTAGFTALQCAFTAKTTREELLLGEKVYVMAPRPGRIHKEYNLPFASMGLKEDLREIKNNKEFVSKREEILSMIWNMEEEIMGKEV